MKPLRLTPAHMPPKVRSVQYLRDHAWLRGFAASKAPGKHAIAAADRAEREYIAATSPR